MKLSTRFFCIAYLIMLISTGIGGGIIISSINSILWKTRIERVNTNIDIISKSFASLMNISFIDTSEEYINDLVQQISINKDETISRVEIYMDYEIEDNYKSIEENECVSQFVRNGAQIFMKSVCKLNIDNNDYYLFLYSDFTDVYRQCDIFWSRYGIVVFCISIISGLVLFILTRKVTSSLEKLEKVTDEITKGNYGKKVNIKSPDLEIAKLSEKINIMSETIEQSISDIKDESEKRGIFIADFTHELKTPMTAIIGYAQMLKSYELSESEIKEASESIYNEAKRLENLSLQLLDLYVYQNEDIQMDDISLLIVKNRLERTLGPLSEKYNIKLEIDFNEDIVYANEALLMSLICNLVDNAIKASEAGSLVKIYNESKEDITRIYVEDTGCGIAKENIKLITEPFFREDKSRSRMLGGAGLGLSLCKEIAARHSTQLYVESEKGKGTTISFVLKRMVK